MSAKISLVLIWLVGCGSVHDTYLQQLRSGTPEQRAQAAEFLGAQRVPEAIPHLRRALHDTASSVRAKTIWALGMLRSKDALHDVARLLSDHDRDVRQVAAWTLMQIEEPEAIPTLERALAVEKDAWVKKDMVRALQHLQQFEGEVDIEEGTVRGQFF